MASNLRTWTQTWDRQPQDLVRLAEDLPFGSLAYIPGLPLLGNAPQSAISAPNSLQYGGTPVGYAVEGNFSSAKLLLGTLPRFRTSQGMTWVAQFVPDTTSTRYVCGTVSTGTSYIEDFGVNLGATETNSAGKVMLLVRTNASSNASRAGSTNAVLTNGTHATVVWEFFGGGSFQLAVNGAIKPITVNLSANVDDAIGPMEFPLALLNRNLRNAFGSGGTGLKLAFFARIPRGGLDIQQISANPYMLIEPRRIWVPVSAAGGGATNLVVADATHGHTADNLVLTTSTALSINDATHAHTADSLTLSVQSVLTVADAAHAHAADNLALTLDTTLAVAEALHAHAADNVVLSLAGVANLDIADASHAHSADSVVLASEHLLAIADALHGHTADGLVLTAESVLAIQEALHAHAADNLTLTVDSGTTLLIAEALHAHTSDGLVLTVDAWLVVADALHGHAAENVQLDDGGGTATALIVADALHAHWADKLSLSPLYPVVVLSASPIGHGPAMGRRTASAGRRRPSQLNSRTR